MIQVQCQTCGSKLSVPDEAAGKIGKCRCGERIRIPTTQSQMKKPPSPEPPPARAAEPSPEARPARAAEPSPERKAGKPKRALVLIGAGGSAAVLLAVVGLWVAFSGKTSKPSEAKPTDPLGKFKEIAQKVSEAEGSKLFEDKEPVRQGFPDILPGDKEEREKWERAFAQGYRWRKFFFWIKDVAYDVQKTDSLVSPYTAVLEFKFYDMQTERLRKAEADKCRLKDCTTTRSEPFKVLYAYQEDRWVVKTILTKDKPRDENPNPRWEEGEGSITVWPELRDALNGG